MSSCPTERENFEPGLRLFASVVVIVSFFIVPGSLVWWHLRRKRYALQKRNFWLVGICGFATLVNVITVCLPIWLDVNMLPCDVQAWTSYWVIPLLAGSVLTRLSLFYNQHRYSQLVLQENSKSDRLTKGRSLRFERRAGTLTSLFRGVLFLLNFKDKRKPGLVQRKEKRRLRFDDRPVSGRRLTALSSPFETKSTIASMSPESNFDIDIMSKQTSNRDRGDSASTDGANQSLLNALYFLSGRKAPLFSMGFFVSYASALSIGQYLPADTPYGGKGCFGCTMGGVALVFAAILTAVVTAIGAIVVHSLRGVPDPLFIKFELQVTLSVGLGAVLVIALAVFDFARELLDNRTFDILILSNVLSLFFHMMQTLYPLYLTYKFESIVNSNEEVSLMEWFSNPIGKDALAKYLATEFSLNNFWFVVKCMEYKQNSFAVSAKDAFSFADEIMKTFVYDSSMLTVNLSFSQRNRLLKRFKTLNRKEHPPSNLFEEAENSIFALIRDDSFPRFKESEIYRLTLLEHPNLFQTSPTAIVAIPSNDSKA